MFTTNMDVAEINIDSEKSYLIECDLCERSDFTVRSETSVDLYTKFLLAVHGIKKNILFISVLSCVKHTFNLL